eukprot:TRINITY_DN15471_c0_g1_i2.p1 TRINITY_DN15471_c0_g1~~TRINITY_DN15471_c0_g1_i2.p1  ORF type:complete len:264 (+),score=12.76 TRINITY_DN15471_c0_g1_i2:137-928(+)
MLGSSSPKYFWILSRTPRMEPAIYEMLLEKARRRGYNLEKLVKVQQRENQNHILEKQMLMKSITTFAFIFSLVFSFSSGFAQSDKSKAEKLVYKFNIKENIAPAIWRQTKQAFAEADTLKADLFLIHMNTYGGTVVDADSIRTRILHSKIPTVVFVDNNAASAGALISIACGRIYMRSGASLGAATVVNQTGEKMPDKYQSYMRATMRATAEAHGKDTIINGQDTHVLCVDTCLLYTSDAADDMQCVDLGGRRIIKKKIKEGT